jgi:hypothetical protein
MKERIEIGKSFAKGFTGAIKDQISGEIDSKVRSLDLFQYQWARRIVDKSIRGIEVEPIPPYLGERERAILVSNYPSVTKTTRAVLKVGCRLPGAESRLKAIARKEIITEANLFLKAIRVDKLVFPAQKDDSGVYRLENETRKETLIYLGKPGHVIWLSMTGETRGNGLLEEDLRTGAAMFSLMSRAPIVPMGVVTKEKKGKTRVVKIKFGEPIHLPKKVDLVEFEIGDLLVDYSRLTMCRIAELLPPGQRGSFENTEEKLAEINKRLETYQLRP